MTLANSIFLPKEWKVLSKQVWESCWLCTLSHDSLIEETVSGALAAKSFRESDTKGFYESEAMKLRRQFVAAFPHLTCLGYRHSPGARTTPCQTPLVGPDVAQWSDTQNIHGGKNGEW